MYKYHNTILDGSEKLIEGIENIEMFLGEDDNWNFHDSEIRAFSWDDDKKVLTITIEPIGCTCGNPEWLACEKALLDFHFEDVFDIQMNMTIPNYINEMEIRKFRHGLECRIKGYQITVTCGSLRVDKPRFIPFPKKKPIKVKEDEYQPKIFLRRDLDEDILRQMPIFRQAKHLLDSIETNGELKLTNTGNLPPAIVKDLYPIGLPEWEIENSITKLRTENDCRHLQMTHYVLIVLKAIKKTKGALTLTRYGKELLQNPSELAYQLFYTSCFKFNLGFSDGYDETYRNISSNPEVLLDLLKKFGNEPQTLEFYCRTLAGIIQDEVFAEYENINHLTFGCFKLRMIELLLANFGLVESKETNLLDTGSIEIKKSTIFDSVIKTE